ncbi:MAG: RluA family pseudouridine synthase [Spirochaetaceae bacterium]|nr:RluA family pseudouridine synthase [Spirochaetaceae bacterium]
MAIKEIKHEFIIEDLESRIRVDAFIASNIEGLSRSQVASKDSIVLVNDKKVKNSSKIFNGDRVEFTYFQQDLEKLEATDIPLNILYEDDDIIAINKDQGIIVHPGSGNFDGTLVNALAFHLGSAYQEAFIEDLSEPEEEDEDEIESYKLDPLRPGIVHRLDKDTSGSMVVAKNKESYYDLVKQFKERTTKKSYIAIVKGVFTKRRGKILSNIIRDPKDRKKFKVCSDTEGKNAETTYVVLKQYEGFALLRVNIHTGRTHQIRVHLSSINHPVLGDPIYSNISKRFRNATLMLHAIKLEIIHPKTGETINFVSPMPDRFKKILKVLPSFAIAKGQGEKYYESAVKVISHTHS